MPQNTRPSFDHPHDMPARGGVRRDDCHGSHAPRLSMELHQLEYLRAVVRAGSVTRAAEEGHVSQPAISKQVRLLEQELGVALFHRVGRRVLPTEAGLLL